MTPAGNRKTGEDTRITLHLQDMRAKTEMKNNKEQPPHTSTSGVISPTPRMQSRGLTSVTTEGTDTTYNSKKDSGISTDASNIDSSDRKENRNPLTRYDSIDLNTDKLLPDSPTHSDVSSSSCKDVTANSPTLRHFSKRALHEPTITVSTTVGVVSARQNQHIDIGRELIEKLTTPSKGKVISFGNSRDEKYNYAHGETNALRKSVPSPTRNVSHQITRQSHADENTEALVNKERQSIYNKYKLHMKVNTVDKPSNNQIGDENNNLVTGNQPAQIRRYIQNNKLLIRRGMVKTDLNKPHDNNVYIVNADPYPQPSPSINRIIPKQLIPFRSAQDRPRLSEIHPLHDLKQYQKAKTSESMSLHGKNVLNTYNGDSSPASKRPVSPPQKPAVVRRKLAKRHRIGELTPPGSHVIQDPDPILNTDLLITDILDMKIGTEGMNCDRKSPLPSISPQHSHR